MSARSKPDSSALRTTVKVISILNISNALSKHATVGVFMCDDIGNFVTVFRCVVVGGHHTCHRLYHNRESTTEGSAHGMLKLTGFKLSAREQ